MKDPQILPPRTRQVFEALRTAIAERGYPPSVRELGLAVGLKSPSSIKHQLDLLQELGFIFRESSRPRAVEILVDPPATQPAPKLSKQGPLASTFVDDSPTAVIPLVGQIAAGTPITADQHIEDVFTLPTALTGHGELFMLKVKGDSMVDAAICDGDYVVVRRQPTAEDGQIVAALINDEATVKVLSRQDGHAWLLPRNPSYQPIDGKWAQIMGKVVTVVRSL